MTVEPHQVRREEGSGSRSIIEDKKTDVWDSKDQRSQTETTFWESDIKQLQVSERRKRELRQALRRQEGQNPGEAYQTTRTMRADANREEWKRRITSTYASYVGLTRHQKERSKHLVMDVLDFTGFSHFTKEQCILAVLNVVAREDGRWLEDENSFRKLMEDEGLTPREVRSLRRMVRDRL